MINTPFQQMDIEKSSRSKTVTKRKMRPCVSNICTTLVFIVFMSGTAFLSNSFHYLPPDTVEIVEHSGRINTMFSFVPFWSDEEIVTFHKYDNVFTITSFIHDNQMYKMCRLTYDIHSFDDFAEQFATKNLPTLTKFALFVAEQLSHNFTTGNGPVYSVKTMQCDDKTSVFAIAQYLATESAANNGSNNAFIPRFFYNNTLYKECQVKYRINSFNDFIKTFMNGSDNIVAFMDNVKANMVDLLEINKTASPSEYAVTFMMCGESPVCNYTITRATRAPRIVEINIEVDLNHQRGNPLQPLQQPHVPKKSFTTFFNGTQSTRPT